MTTSEKLQKKVKDVPNGTAQLSAVELNLVKIIAKLSDKVDKLENDQKDFIDEILKF